ncbi:putative golgi SNAP receptor complex member 1 [Podospora fimiseda]|uniref:Golgi SNAP receptor complex member 1 n=1 Tax=Podospora fimiseda TaxID=252190 RepID=A0AAN7BPA5_9PEZI|nr:putative golgi SNAP receptor complex member 1 [Podospora fimiseda]
MASSGLGWAQLRQQARALETQTETYLHTYSQFSNQTNIPLKPTEEERSTEAKLQELLEKRENVIAQLTRLLDSEISTTAIKQSNLALLRDKLSDHRRDLSRLRNNLKEARDRANLLPNIRDEISAHRAANPAAEEAEYMLGERNRVDNSINVVDGVINQAYSVREGFVLQRETLASINRRITGAASQVPGINAIIGRISAKKRRDGIIMGGFIAFCFLVFWFML